MRLFIEKELYDVEYADEEKGEKHSEEIWVGDGEVVTRSERHDYY